jgi:hypothetical protein
MTPLAAAILGVTVGLLLCAGVGVLLLILMVAIDRRHRETMTAYGQVLARVIGRVRELELKVRLDAG